MIDLFDFFDDEKTLFTTQRLKTVSNGIGGTTSDYTDYIINYCGIFDSLRGAKKEIANSQTVDSTHLLICDVLDIDEKDRIKVKNKTYKIDFIDNPLNIDDHLEIYLKVI